MIQVLMRWLNDGQDTEITPREKAEVVGQKSQDGTKSLRETRTDAPMRSMDTRKTI
jgi:hypothetical protein